MAARSRYEAPVEDYREAARRRVLVYDGATGTNLQTAGLTAADFGGPDLEGCNEALNLHRPDVVADLHALFLDVGVDVIETNTFGAFAVPLAEYGLGDRAYDIARAGAEIAREITDRYTTEAHPRWVAGSLGPGTKFASLGQIRFADLRDAYRDAALGLLDGGVDLFIVETQFDLLGLKAAIHGCRAAMADAGRTVPIQAQVTMEATGKMLPGTEIGAALAAIEPLGVDVFGLNCATGPDEMHEHLRYLADHARTPISAVPNAGLPEVVDGAVCYRLEPDALADHLARFVTDYGVTVVGGCCGTTPEHLAAVVDRVRGLTPAERRPVSEPGATSLYSFVPFKQDTSFLIIGERTNANGSKAFRRALLDEDWDAALQIATNQVKESAHLLDVCVDYVGRDGVADMDAIASRFATQVAAPLVVDSTEPEVMEAALQWIGGRAVLNSANLEDGDGPGSRAHRVFRLAKAYGAAVICLLIDERGQARDVEWKMDVAHRLYRLATERYGLEPGDLLFDPLTFPLSTGDDDLRGDAMATLEAIRRIKTELPGVFTVLGVSNVSFGLAPATRHVLNSVFLHEAVAAGLDAAIVHAGRIVPLHRISDDLLQTALDLIYDRRAPGYDPLVRLLEVADGTVGVTAVAEDRSGWPVEERLKARIVDGERDGLEADLDEALAERSALSIINDVLLEAMQTVGDLFASGDMQLPFVLQSAEAMKAAVAHLEPHLERSDVVSKGTVVLATVAGDVHDIGKNLVDIILTNNGYQVRNLGIKVPLSDMLAAVEEHGAAALGMSGLLVKSTLIMRDNLDEMARRGVDVPVLLGGAALTRSYVERDLRPRYPGPVHYGKDAFEGLRILDALRNGETVETPQRIRVAKPAGTRPPAAEAPARSPHVAVDNPVFTPPFIGSRVVDGIPLDDIAAYLNETALFRNQWQFRPAGDETDTEFKQRLRPLLEERLAEAGELLQPAVVYGYFPVNADGNDLIVWKDDTRSAEQVRFTFPRQSTDPWLCIADFFRPVGTEADYAAFHIVTMGSRVSEVTAELFAADRYRDYLLTHGLGVEMAEALAEYWHRHIREEWGFGAEDGPTLRGLFRQQYRGGRYSWGYPACPDLEDNAKVADLLEAGRIGVVCSEETAWQYQPEQTTSAIIVHHPSAKYFVAR